MKYVYIASPYTRGNQEENVERSLAYAERILLDGDIPFCPLLYHYWHKIHYKDYDTWLDLSLSWVRKCDVLVRLPGESHGADEEVELAKKLNIPVIYYNDESSPIRSV